ncbi:MAG: putative RND superfamily exporter protein [Cyclobacteriaceae bacterium]|jgi:predicted RND superfamily exporter protein
MANQIQYVQWSYDLANIVPDTDPEMQYLQEFKKTFGEDGNVMALGVEDSALYSLENFQRFQYLTTELNRLDGVVSVLGLTNIKKLTKNSQNKSFELKPVFAEIPQTQAELDSLLHQFNQLQFYAGQLSNSENGATLILITINKEVMNSEARFELIPDIVMAGEQFEEVTGIDVHFAGLPYVRAVNMVKIRAELIKFVIYSIIITGIILFLFFRSFKAVFFPLVIIGIIVVWVIGTLALLGYEITILSGLIPSIIIVIGIPNSVYMLNKYHQEYAKHGDQKRALGRIIRKIGIVTLITNFTTAIGFLVLVVTDITILKEFGIVAGINIMATFVVSIILIPAFYSYLAPPSVRHLKHLEFKTLGWALDFLDHIVHKHRIGIFIMTFIITVIAGYGVTQIKAVSFMVDDLPEKSPLKQDLVFFERNFSGIMPLEIVIDTGTKKGVQNLKNLRAIDQLETFLDSIEFISQPVSLVSFVKAARQAYYNDNPAYYDIPNSRDAGFILRYLRQNEDQKYLTKSFVDSTGQVMRISLKIADIGSNRMDSLVNQVIRPKTEELFGEGKMSLNITGTTLMFIKGNKFLIANLIQSLIIAFVIISIIMAILFRNFKMIIISLITNMIPLLITAGIMGYFGIPLKPSTALIFSIAFGISVDDSIHFLAKYRQELFSNKFLVPLAVSKSIRETGASMIYTSIILFFGFVIFGLSEFGGTVALGKLTSITLLFAMLTNVIVLPALLLQFDSGKRNKAVHPLIEKYPEFAEENSNKSNPTA